MRKLFLFFILDYYLERIKAKYKPDYDELSSSVKIKEADDE